MGAELGAAPSSAPIPPEEQEEPLDLEDLLTPKLVSEREIEILFQSALRLIDVDDSGEGPTETIH